MKNESCEVIRLKRNPSDQNHIWESCVKKWIVWQSHILIRSESYGRNTCGKKWISVGESHQKGIVWKNHKWKEMNQNIWITYEKMNCMKVSRENKWISVHLQHEVDTLIQGNLGISHIHYITQQGWDLNSYPSKQESKVLNNELPQESQVKANKLCERTRYERKWIW